MGIVEVPIGDPNGEVPLGVLGAFSAPAYPLRGEKLEELQRCINTGDARPFSTDIVEKLEKGRGSSPHLQQLKPLQAFQG